MRTLITLSICLVALWAVAMPLHADEGKEVTLNGTITCAKCDLKVADKCATVIKVNEGGHDVVYYFDHQGHKDHHKAICTEPKEGTVTGIVSEQDGKKIIKVSKVDFK